MAFLGETSSCAFSSSASTWRQIHNDHKGQVPPRRAQCRERLVCVLSTWKVWPLHACTGHTYTDEFSSLLFSSVLLPERKGFFLYEKN